VEIASSASGMSALGIMSSTELGNGNDPDMDANILIRRLLFWQALGFWKCLQEY